MSSGNNQQTTRPPLRKPVFIKVNQILPETTGINVAVKVLSNTVVDRSHSATGKNNAAAKNAAAKNTRIAEYLVGDETAAIIFTARNEQVDIMKPGATVIVRNGKIDMFKKETMRLAVDKWGRLEVTEPAGFTVHVTNNMSEILYELVDRNKAQGRA